MATENPDRVDKRRHRLLSGDLGAVIIFALLTILFFWPYLNPVAGQRIYFPQGDFTHQFFAYRALSYRSLSQGDLPLWGSCLFSGYPFQADPQSALFYPPTLLLQGLLLMSGFPDYPLSALVFEVIFHVFLTACFSYLFLRSQVGDRRAALFGAVVFGFGGFLTSYPLLQVAILEGVTWFPLALWGVNQCLRKGNWGFLILSGVALAFSILAGHPQTSFLVLLATGAFTVFAGWREKVGKGRTVAYLALLVSGAAALSAIQWLPSWELLQYSARPSLSIQEAGGGFPFEDILQLVITRVVSFWHPLYVGILPLFLAAFAWAGPRHRRADVLFWSGLAAAALLLSFGNNSPAFRLAYLFFPGYRLFHGQERHALLVSFALSVLATFGAAALFAPLSTGSRRWLRRAIGFFPVLLVLGLLAFAAVFYTPARVSLPEKLLSLPERLPVSLVFVLFTLVLLAARLLFPKRQIMPALGALALVVIDLFSQNQAVNASGPYQLFPVTPLVRPMVEDQGLFRIQDDFRLPGHTACMLGLKELAGMSPLRLASYEAFLERVPERVRFELLAVRYVVSWRQEIISQQGEWVESQVLYEDDEGTRLHRLQEPQPWAFVVHEVQFARDSDDAFTLLSAPGFDSLRTVILEEPLPVPVRGGSGRAEVVLHQPHQIILEAELDEPGVLVVSEIFYPGWNAYVDGQRVPVYRANGILRAVLLDAGSHQVRMAYEPLSFRVGALISVISWLVLIATIFWRSRKRSVRT